MNTERGEASEGGQKANRRAARQAARRQQQVRRVLYSVLTVVVLGGAVFALTSFFGGSSEPAGPSSSVTITATDFDYEPDPVLALAGELEITFVNDGLTGHELRLLRPGIRIATAAEYDEASMQLAELFPSIAMDTTVSRTVTIDPGTYQLVCILAGHLEAGMEADLVVS